ncbi:outer membrane lipoprotein chaperone LolA [Alteromonas salexigens]|nr:outer membrane lipoprotein chaperone LolA [Alteromonas salexigens]
MKTLSFSMAFLLTFTMPAFAGDTPKADLKALLADMQHYSADFTQTVTDESQEVVHEAKGTLTMTRPDKLRWETTLPDETLLIADGEAVWNIDTFVEQVTIIDQASAVADNPVILLTSQDDETWQQFNVAHGDDNQHFIVKPLSEDGQIRSLSLTFDTGTLRSLSMHDAQSQTSRLVFDNIDTSTAPEMALFEVNVPDTYMIDDQR